MPQARRYNPALLPTRYAKYIVIEWCRDWFHTNGIFRVDPDGSGNLPPPPLDAEGRPVVREDLSGLFIRDEHSENPQTDKTTGIVVQRGSVNAEYKGGIGNNVGKITQRVPMPPRRPDDKTAPKPTLEIGLEKRDLVSIPLQVWCLSKVGLEADEIGNNVFFGLHFTRGEGILQQRFPAIHDISGMVLGQEEPVRLATTTQELVGVRVSMTLELEYFWQVYKRGDLPLRFITFGVNAPVE